MSKPVILAKSDTKLSRMKNKINLGADGLEIQLLGEFLPKEDGKFLSVDECFSNLKDMLEVPVLSVHCPLIDYVDEAAYKIPPNLEIYMQPTWFPVLENTFDLANRFGKAQNHQVRVVVHTELNAKRLNECEKYMRDEIFKVVHGLLDKYPYTIICLENVCSFDPDGEHFTSTNGFGFDNVKIVKTYREMFPEHKDRIYTCLDICHAEMTKQVIGMLHGYEEIIHSELYRVENYFINNAETCGLIHMSKTVGNGISKAKHGKPFEDKYTDKKIIEHYMYYYNKYDYTCPICLEVSETDYDISDGFAVSNRLLRQVLKERE